MTAELSLRATEQPAAEQTSNPPAPGLRWTDGHGRSLLAPGKTALMGILNVTPDSFSDGGKHLEPGRAEEAALQMAADGADIIDVGGMSTRPGAAEITVDEELARVMPVLERLGKNGTLTLSIDTYRAPVAERALDAGAVIVNDISGFSFDEQMAPLCARKGAAVALMHTTGKPDVMMTQPLVGDVVKQVGDFLETAKNRALRAGIDEEHIVLDPGFGFGKPAEQGWELLARLGELRRLGRPLLVGVSRKSMFKELLAEGAPAHERDISAGTAAAVAVMNGARIIRAHHVPITRQCVAVADRMGRNGVRL